MMHATIGVRIVELAVVVALAAAAAAVAVAGGGGGVGAAVVAIPSAALFAHWPSIHLTTH